MTKPRVTRILCAADPGGSIQALDAVLQATEDRDVQALALIGDLGAHGDGDSLRAVFRTLAHHSHRNAYWVPGPGDAPVGNYLREAQNIEVVAQSLRGVHGTAAYAPDGHVVFAGLGGEVSDDPEEAREEGDRLRYPRWEPEYRLKVLSELAEHQLVLMFWTRPAHKGLGLEGSEVLAELVATHRPRLVVCAGERGTETIGRSLVVAPGSIRNGHYAIVDMHTREAEFEELAAGAGAG